MRLKVLSTIFILFIFLGSCRKSDYLLETGPTVLTDNGGGTGTVTWSKDKDYLLEGYVFVNDGQTLTIEAGTVIRFKTGQAENASALIVARGGKIIAEGTREEPIIFTVEGDDLEGSVPVESRGLWGGVIILGNAPLNVDGGEAAIEGIPFSEPRIVYGGVDENDNSGILKYVSIRHGGTNIGEGNEINGLTLGGVGNGTTIEYVEVLSNEDDGIEIFGGTVNLEHIVVAYCGDDAFDYDLGWRGNGQYWLGVQALYLGDKLIEAGGGQDPIEGTPYSTPYIYNGTFYGKNGLSTNPLVGFENNAGGYIANSIFLNNKKGILLQYTDQLHDSYHQWERGNLEVKNNIFYDVADNQTTDIFYMNGTSSAEQKQSWADYFTQANNEIKDPDLINSINNFVPNSKLSSSLTEYPNDWFQQVDFIGAFSEDNWIEGWTALSEVEE